MPHLHEALAKKVNEWRQQGYHCKTYPAINEILEYAYEDNENQQLLYLRSAQFKSLETYWYLRLVMGTKKVPELYAELFPKTSERLAAMGLAGEEINNTIMDESWNALFDKIRTDNAFVRKHHLESLRETITLDYASYILALAMGAGKTILMATIVATEFAMAQEYPEPDAPFVQNALIFAPGKTILESLREIADIPFEKILPPRMYGPFSASLKLTFTRDGDKELPVVWGSSWNIVVTNTEKIRIQKKTRGKKKQMQLALTGREEDHDAEIANLRLQAIASLPHLAIFSDEAHHTYGQKLLGKWQKDKTTGEDIFVEQGIKKVRRTVDFLAQETNLIVVVNTTGTPYFERQPLRDVVVWYGLGEGIHDGVLKELANNIQVFDLDESQSEPLLERIINDFIDTYWQVALDDGSPARLALYFPQTEALEDLRPVIESVLAQRQIDTTAVLTVHSKSTASTKQDFYRVANDPQSPHRIILLVNMGTEGWNCPSLFACGLIRKLKTSNNFVLQAATRCLRQVPGNTMPARVYVSKGNRTILEKQLTETYGTSIAELNHEITERVEKTIEIRKPELPPLLIKKRILRYKYKQPKKGAHLKLKKPDTKYNASGHIETWTIAEPKDGKVKFTRVDGGEDTIVIEPAQFSHYGAAAELAANYHLDATEILSALKKIYPENNVIPEHHLAALGAQIEKQRCNYEEDWEEIEVALALIKPEGFTRQLKKGQPVYTARVSFAKNRAHLYKTAKQLPDDKIASELSFHYEGYNFDSQSEADYLERVLNLLKQNADDIDGIWFTGGLTDPNKTELFAEYLGDDNRWHRYTPDFVLRRKDGKHLIVELNNYGLKVHRLHQEGLKVLLCYSSIMFPVSAFDGSL